jgi:hypothetical protein
MIRPAVNAATPGPAPTALELCPGAVARTSRQSG